MKPNIYSGCIVKPNEPDDCNDDAIRVDKENNIYAIADGAGGAGVHCSQWAKYILENIPTKPITTAPDFEIWFNKIRTDYHNNKIAELQNNEPALVEKYLKEGSLCTLVVLWIVDKKTFMLSCGDSALFLFTKKMYFCNLTYPAFMQRPHLLASHHPFPLQEVYFKQDNFIPQQHYVLCSDAIAQYLFCAYLYTHSKKTENEAILEQVRNDYEYLSQYTIDLGKKAYAQKEFKKDILKPLKNACNSKETFANYLYALNQTEELPYDDYSVIIIN